MVFGKVKQFGSQLSELKKLRHQAMALQRELKAEKVTVEENDVRVVMSGDMKIQELETGQADSAILVEVLNKAIKRTQEVAARKLQEMGGDLSSLLK